MIQIQNIFSLSILVMSETFPSQVLSAASREADPSSIAVGYIFRDVSPKTMNSVPVSFFAGPGNEIIYIALPTSTQLNLRSISGCEKVPISGLGHLLYSCYLNGFH